MKRCEWASDVVEIYQNYHDHEWGVPVYDDQKLFEMFILESFHTGLSWLIILKKREAFRQAFDHFNVDQVKCYKEEKIAELMQNAAIVRNEAKIRAAISNAVAFCHVQQEFGSFSKYIWRFTENQVLVDRSGVTKNALSDHIAKDLKKRGFKFMGSVTLYSYMQAIGIIDGHSADCFRVSAST